MDIILKQAVEKLGEEGEQVKVADGYARNYLLPKGLAVKATKKNIAMLQRERELIAQKQQREVNEAQKIANKIRSLSCVLSRQAGDQDKLFGSVTSQDIAEFLQNAGVDVDRKKIHLDEPIKTLGVHRIPIKVHPEVTVELKVKIQKEE